MEGGGAEALEIEAEGLEDVRSGVVSGTNGDGKVSLGGSFAGNRSGGGAGGGGHSLGGELSAEDEVALGLGDAVRDYGDEDVHRLQDRIVPYPIRSSPYFPSTNLMKSMLLLPPSSSCFSVSAAVDSSGG